MFRNECVHLDSFQKTNIKITVQGGSVDKKLKE